MGASEYQDRFLLKGASLLALWFAQPHRPTRDIDLLGFSSSEISDVETIFRDICLSKTREDDGFLFKAESVKAAEIKEDQEYGGGVKITLAAFTGKARINLQIDVCFGDAVTLQPETVMFPTMLDFPTPILRASSEGNGNCRKI